MGIEQEYFEWLYGQVGYSDQRNPSRSYRLLVEQFHNTEFVQFVPNDDNRLADGLDLRNSFVDHIGGVSDDDLRRLWDSPCSFLEMLIALAIRIAYQVELVDEFDGGVGEWFWTMVRNLDLDGYNDEAYMSSHPGSYIETVLTTVIHRRYESNGNGGLFPLRNPLDDQRDVELWYQMSIWLMENTNI